MTLEAFVPAILSQLAWTMFFIVAVGVGVSVSNTVKQIRRRWGFIGLKPRYAVAYLSHSAARQLNC